jgi:N-methylhydantoinase A
MQSNGGVMPGGYVAERAVGVMGSGPAGGVMGATAVAGAAGVTDFISVDMGRHELRRVARAERRARGEGGLELAPPLPRRPADGGRADGRRGRRLDRAHRSRCAEGRAAERRLGAGPGVLRPRRHEPTVTDANVVLGYLNPDAFCGGTMRLDAEGATAAIRERIAKPLGLTVVEAAEGIFRLVNANMANAVRKASAQKGIDPRR